MLSGVMVPRCVDALAAGVGRVLRTGKRHRRKTGFRGASWLGRSLSRSGTHEVGLNDERESAAHDTVAICAAQHALGEPGRRGAGTTVGLNRAKAHACGAARSACATRPRTAHAACHGIGTERVSGGTRGQGRLCEGFGQRANGHEADIELDLVCGAGAVWA